MRIYWKFLLLLVLIGFSFTNKYTTPLYFEIPKNWPKPKYDFKRNPLTEEGFQLGRNLFLTPFYHVTIPFPAKVVICSKPDLRMWIIN
ncbi:hypothetical protein QWY90_00760 [Flavobacterium paronense]|uniref:hypothetical protein n=1 Tax=Flavobacterium paronense TaxID=1392775 RepID=UPI0025B39D0F|nr:hypothetical protein [Flavobacterium paronense]MDN3675873.1 hypothetical protein [Flavobacterium paronense]